jgi:hypothetical protein
MIKHINSIKKKYIKKVSLYNNLKIFYLNFHKLLEILLFIKLTVSQIYDKIDKIS